MSPLSVLIVARYNFERSIVGAGALKVSAEFGVSSAVTRSSASGTVDRLLLLPVFAMAAAAKLSMIRTMKTI
jgi:hypothetical protein